MDADNLSILLYIAQGTGFDLKIGNIILVATLGGNSLETKPVQSSTKIEFDCNLIWETNRKSVKRMKTENLPIKLECFLSEFPNGQEIRSLIGYVLIPLKSIPVTLVKNRTVYKPHWHKLFGLNSEWKIKKPEVCLHVLITNNIPQNSYNLYERKNQNSRKDLRIDCFDTSAMLSSQKGLYIELLNEEELLQVGDKETNCDIFNFNLIFLNAKNLEYAINHEENRNQLFRLNYNLLGTLAHCVLSSLGNNTFSIQEEIGIHFRTSIQSLKEYFSKVFYIPVELFYGDSLVGTAVFNLNNILQIDDLSEFLAKYTTSNDCTFTYKSTVAIQTDFNLPQSALAPYIEFVFSLKYISTSEESEREIIMDNLQSEESINVIGNEKSSERNKSAELLPATNVNEVTLKNSLDLQETIHDTNNNSQKVTIDNKASDSNSKLEFTPVPEKAHFVDKESAFLGKTDINTLIKEKSMTKSSKNIFRTFSFNLTLQTIKFNRRIDTGIWQISLQHQNADTIYTVSNIELTEISSNSIELKNLMLQLFFSSSVDNVFEIISSESCILKIYGPRGVFASAELDNEILLANNNEKHSGVVLMENQNSEKCALAYISVSIEDLGISFNSQIKKHHTNIDNNQPSKVAYFDENLAYKIVEELEDWKQKELESFLVELKRKEVNHLAMLSIEWQKRKSELENALSNKLEECSQLYDTLEKAKMTLNEQGLNYLEHEKLYEKVEKNTEEKFSKIITSLNEKIQRIEDEMEHKIKLEQLNYKELELENINMEKEKLSLTKNLDKLQKAYDELKQHYVPKEQLDALFRDMNVLHGRFEKVQKSQQFYKGQWAKATRELHKMKIVNLQGIAEQTTSCRATKLHNLLENEKNEFYIERDQLNEIKADLENLSDEECESCYESD